MPRAATKNITGRRSAVRCTASPRTQNLDFRGCDSSILLISRGEIPRLGNEKQPITSGGFTYAPRSVSHTPQPGIDRPRCRPRCCPRRCPRRCPRCRPAHSTAGPWEPLLGGPAGLHGGSDDCASGIRRRQGIYVRVCIYIYIYINI